MHLGIIKITYNRTASILWMTFCEPRRGGKPAFAMTTGASESATVCFVFGLSVCYWLFKCGVLCFVCVWESRVSCLNHGLCADGKTKDIINCLYIHFKSWNSRLWKGVLISGECLRCSANHNVLCQLTNQSRLRLSEGGTL